MLSTSTPPTLQDIVGVLMPIDLQVRMVCPCELTCIVRGGWTVNLGKANKKRKGETK